jgi:predicted HTH domain antitoxin
MRHLVIDIPDTVDMDDHEIVLLLASRLYEQGKLSLGQAAALAGVSKRAFTELLGKYGVSIFNSSPDDLADDVKNA